MAARVPLPPAPERLTAAARAEAGDEAIAWAGRPGARAEALAALPLLLFGVPWLAFSLFWEGVVVASLLSGNPGGAPAVAGIGMGVAALFGLPFVAIGVWLVAAPVIAAHRASRTLWLVTGRRLVRLVAGRRDGVEVTTWAGARVSGTRRRERADGSGWLRVDLGRERDADGDVVISAEVLRGLPDARAAEAAVLALRERAART